MLKEIRTLSEDKSKMSRVYTLQSRGRIKRYINENGYACYDTDELDRHDAAVRRGRPLIVRPTDIIITTPKLPKP